MARQSKPGRKAIRKQRVTAQSVRAQRRKPWAPKLFGQRAAVFERADETRAPLYVWGSCAVYVETGKRGERFDPHIVWGQGPDRVWLRVGRAKTLNEALKQLEGALTGLRSVLPNCPGDAR